jgi:Lon protease-like protein
MQAYEINFVQLWFWFPVHSRYFEASNPKMANIGTTAEIYEYRDEEDLAGFCIKAKGRQRFRVMESQRQVDG